MGTPQNSTEEYDGTSWSAGGTITIEYPDGGENPGATGASSSSAIAVGGLSVVGGGVYAGSNKTQHYDGTSWTAGGNLLTGRQYHSVMGTETDGLVAGGGTGFYVEESITSSEEYDGTSWSAGGNLNANKRFEATSGISSSSGAWTGGSDPGTIETYNGTSWSVGPAMSQHRGSAGGAGNYAAGLMAAGNIFEYTAGGVIAGNTATTEELTGGGISIRTI